MSNDDAVRERAAAIREYLSRHGKDPSVAHPYSVAAARWEELRLSRHRGLTRPQDDTRLRVLEVALSELSEELGLGPGITCSRGFLKRDPSRIICRTWQDAAEAWFG
jgi:hypothetical protein